jgi:hypothetical protein
MFDHQRTIMRASSLRPVIKLRFKSVPLRFLSENARVYRVLAQFFNHHLIALSLLSLLSPVRRLFVVWLSDGCCCVRVSVALKWQFVAHIVKRRENDKIE